MYTHCTQFRTELSQFWIFNYFANTDIPHILCTQFSVQLTQFWTFNFSAYPVMLYIYIVHNFPLNIRISGYSIFLLIKTFCTNNVHNFPLNFRNSGYWIFCANPDIPYIYNVLNFPFYLRSSGYSILLQMQTFHTYIRYTISRQFKIFKFFANPDIPYILCIQFPVQFMQFWKFNFSINPYILYIYNVNNFPLNICSSGYSIFLLI